MDFEVVSKRGSRGGAEGRLGGQGEIERGVIDDDEMRI